MQNNYRSKIGLFWKGFSISFPALILFIIFIRVFELLYVKVGGNTSIDVETFFMGLNFDLFLCTLLSCILLVPLLPLSILLPRLSLSMYNVCCAFLLFVFIALTHFFLTNNYLLSSEILFFSFKDLTTVVAAELSFNRLTLWSLYLLIPLLIFLQIYLFRKNNMFQKWKRIFLFIFIAISLSVVYNITSYEKSLSDFSIKYNYYVANNKLIYLGHSLMRFHEAQKAAHLDDESIQQNIREFHKINKLKYLSETYPLCREDDIENVLGPYFGLSDKKPNIVLIISESLSSSFSGKHATLANLTPFMDSLMNKGLYWRNFISNAERSYGALPNILSSLPHGSEHGFLYLYGNGGRIYPRHNSLIRILKKDGYSASYYYGGWGYFEHAGNFLEFNDIDKIYSDHTFNKIKYDRSNGKNDGIRWGYNDKDLFNHILDEADSLPANKPYLSIITTISLHTPYNMCTKEYYNADYITQRLKSLGLDRKQLVARFKHVPKDQIDSYNLDEKTNSKIAENVLASIFFADDALRDFFKQYAKRKDYDNTIFIITGDHNIGTLPLRNELDNYRVPLVVVSPLLKQAKEFQAVSSHIDILPSLLALLNKNYGLQIPITYNWMGIGLDTASAYRNRNSYALSLYSDNFPNFFYKDYLVSGNKVYHVTKNLELSKATNQHMKDSVPKIMKNYSAVNRYVCYKDRITDSTDSFRQPRIR